MISIEFLITSLILVLIPGTGVIYTISTGLFQGARASFSAALGCTLGIVPSMLASIFGLAVILNTSAMAFQVVKFIGVAYLLYLAWCMWRETGGLALEKKEEQNINLFQVALKGCLINVLNPKLTIFFLAFLPQFINSNVTSATSKMLLLGGIFMAMTLIVFILYGTLASKARRYLIGSSKVAKYMQRTFAASFALLGMKLAFTDR
ncbi:Threonine/homoserine/homoserine lactone efflux protein [Marinomonas polaris DSM 16579]|uniref:Threonine/homoserine/homoserine lactone efflux protein n=1 Tax=Marinomonas polaris DSM 16579 TaxID=1122206 RepID=A0A1M4XC14_9GAMM|nr:LysE family translocator [Marinomonas polaris]SHE91077.1 Threonine/homoserine/homoserine lactone efflux protein [Marinomonas polaris DSM 16579]